MANRILYFVRHGQYKSTTTPPDEPDGPLTDLGREQVACTAERLQTIPFSFIHFSTLERAAETAVIIARKFPEIPCLPSNTLRECIPCVPAGFEAHFAHIPEEEIEEGNARAKRAFGQYMQPLDKKIVEDQYELIVGHGNMINYLIGQSINAPEASWLFTDIENAAVSQVTIFASGVMKLSRHNDIGHFPSHLITVE